MGVGDGANSVSVGGAGSLPPVSEENVRGATEDSLAEIIALFLPPYELRASIERRHRDCMAVVRELTGHSHVRLIECEPPFRGG